jgi:hypothetical protein
MADSQLKLPGNFQAGQKYLLDGATLKAWQDALRADRVIPGAGLTEQGTPQGRIFKAAISSAPSIPGAFYGMYAAGGHIYLQGGTVSAGDGTDSISDIKIIDGSTGVLHTAGTHMYLNANGNGVRADGVLLPGYNLSSASIGYGSSVPSNSLPLAAGVSGKHCYIDLGTFTADGFLPSGTGNVQISYCPGSYSVSRA